MRADKKKNKAKITKSVLKNPLQSQREIAEDLGIGKTTVQEHLQELKATKDDRIIGLTDKDFNCIVLGVEEIERRLKDKEELSKMKVTEISQVIKDNTARYTLFRGEATNPEGGSKLPAIIKIINPNEENNI